MNRKLGVGFLIGLCSLVLCSCSSTELEDKNFPMAAAIAWKDGSYEMALGFQDLSDVADENATKENASDVSLYGANGYELFEQADVTNPGQMDYNHMKALILSRELFCQEKELTVLLSCMEEQNVISRNTLLFVTDQNPGELVGCSEQIKDNVGNYLQELITSNQDFDADAVVTLGDLLNASHNQNETWMIPRVEVTQEKLELADYYVLQGIVPVGSISLEQGEFRMLCCGQLKHYGIAVDADTVVRLSDISCRYEISGDENQVTETVYVLANADSYAGQMPSDIEEYLTDVWNRQAAELLTAGIDPTNSYYKLGGYDRQVYEYYADDWNQYQQKLRIRFVCTISDVS